MALPCDCRPNLKSQCKTSLTLYSIHVFKNRLAIFPINMRFIHQNNRNRPKAFFFPVTNKPISTVIGKKQVSVAITSYTEAKLLKKDSQTGIHLHNRI